MNIKGKTKEQLIEEIKVLRQRLEAVEDDRRLHENGDALSTEKHLKEERDRAQKYLDVAGVILIAIDSAQRVTLINKRGAELLGYPEEQILGKKWFDNFLPEKARENTIATFKMLMSGEVEPVEYFENPVVTIEGKERIIAWHNIVLKDSEGRINGTLSSGEDITERRQMEIALRESEMHYRKLSEELELRVAERTSQLEAANKELEAFSYSVSHDLRAPLRTVTGFSQALLEDFSRDMPAEACRYLHRIQMGVTQMDRLIKDLLTFSHTALQTLKVLPVRSSYLVNQVIEELKAEQEGREVKITLGDLPVCQGDSSLLRQVFSNLLSNALKFTRNRTVAKIEIGCISEEADEELIFYIRDNGVGFDMQYADKLFGVFQRLHSSEEYEGMGLGLAITQRIIQRHGGRIWAESEKDWGTTFYFTLKKVFPGNASDRKIDES